MILRFEAKRRVAPDERIGAVLSGLKAYWELSREEGALPRSEDLYLSDLMDEMPHLLLAYRCGSKFQIEFAGDAVAAGLEGRVIGRFAEPGNGLPEILVDCIEQCAADGAPRVDIDSRMRVLCLPYRDEFQAVDLVLAAVIEFEEERAAEVVSLVR